MILKQYGIKELDIKYVVKDYTMCHTPDIVGHRHFTAEDDISVLLEKCPNKECQSEGFKIDDTLVPIASRKDTHAEGVVACRGMESQKLGSLSCPNRFHFTLDITYLDAMLP